MSIKVVDIKSNSDAKMYAIPFIATAVGSDSTDVKVVVPFSSILKEFHILVTATCKSSVWTITNLSNSSTLVNALSLSGIATKGGYAKQAYAGSNDISAGSIFSIAVSATATITDILGSIILEKIGNDSYDRRD